MLEIVLHHKHHIDINQRKDVLKQSFMCVKLSVMSCSSILLRNVLISAIQVVHRNIKIAFF